MAVDAQGRTLRRHSGEGSNVGSAIMVVVTLALILLSFYLFAHYDNWLFLLGIAVYGLALLIPTGVLGGKTASRSTSGVETVLDGPPASATNVSIRSGH